MSSTVLSVAKFHLQQLKTVYLQVDMEYDNRKNAAYAVINKLTRDLLNISESFGGCLARPQRDMCSIMMITESDKLKNELFVKHLENNRISIKIVEECDSFCVEKCIPFSIFYFMERVKWFRIGESFVQDGFLWWKQTNLPRIQIKSHCSSTGEVYIKLLAEIVRIYPFEHWALDREERFADFNSGPITHEVQNRWVVCLPKLGKGRIVRVHRRIPETSPFGTYEEMKSYWKHTYGYDLPPAEPEVYYDVLFNNRQTMLYPFYCVLTGPPEAIQIRANATLVKDALDMFLKSFKDASLVIFDQAFSPKENNDQMVKSYMDVISMRAVNPSKLRNDVKVTRKKEENSERSTMTHQIRKVYPKIPTGIKRSISSSGVSSASEKKSRPGLNIRFD